MKALLMYPQQDFDLKVDLPRQAASVTQDLELDTLLNAMAGEDDFLLEVARKGIFSGQRADVTTVLYRQAILRDCLKNPAVVRALYDIALEMIEGKKKNYFGFFMHYPSGILSGSIGMLQMLVGLLKKLRAIANEQAARFDSPGFTTMLAMLQKEISDEYFLTIQEHLKALKFTGGVLLSAALGPGNEGVSHVLRQENDGGPTWLKRLLGKGPPAYTFHIADRDQAGAKALSELQDRGINLVANALAQSTEHIVSFFDMLRAELGFYVGCLNLYDRFASRDVPVCFPVPTPASSRCHRFSALRDACLVLSMEQAVMGNTVDAQGRSLVVITGANTGGKSTFLRSIGVAQMMMQCGMFVVAESFEANLCSGLFTHYKREEDSTMKSGKFDEEIDRLSGLADALAPDSMVLFNESFASTNEREGSEIARETTCALLERRIKVFFVTHQYEFAHGMFERSMQDALFLRAERQADGTRTFRLNEGEPLATSYGEDLYRDVFERNMPEAETGAVET